MAALSSPKPVFRDDAGLIAEVGDVVTIRYDASPDRPIRIRLSKTENRPADGIVHIAQPLGSAVLGTSVDDEIEVVIGGRRKNGVVERIDKATRQQAEPMMADA